MNVRETKGMSYTIDAHCFHCGYDVVIGIGAGRKDTFQHGHFAFWPVSCETCHEISSVNYKEPPLFCGACWSENVLPISDPRLCKADSEIPSDWGLFVQAEPAWGFDLEAEKYRCPKCGAFELRFGTNVAGHELQIFC